MSTARVAAARAEDFRAAWEKSRLQLGLGAARPPQERYPALYGFLEAVDRYDRARGVMAAFSLPGEDREPWPALGLLAMQINEFGMAMMAYTFEHQAALDRELQLLAAQRGAWQAGRELLH
jgi:hypothetical protein